LIIFLKEIMRLFWDKPPKISKPYLPLVPSAAAASSRIGASASNSISIGEIPTIKEMASNRRPQLDVNGVLMLCLIISNTPSTFFEPIFRMAFRVGRFSP